MEENRPRYCRRSSTLSIGEGEEGEVVVVLEVEAVVDEGVEEAEVEAVVVEAEEAEVDRAGAEADEVAAAVPLVCAALPLPFSCRPLSCAAALSVLCSLPFCSPPPSRCRTHRRMLCSSCSSAGSLSALSLSTLYVNCASCSPPPLPLAPLAPPSPTSRFHCLSAALASVSVKPYLLSARIMAHQPALRYVPRMSVCASGMP